MVNSCIKTNSTVDVFEDCSHRDYKSNVVPRECLGSTKGLAYHQIFSPLACAKSKPTVSGFLSMEHALPAA